MKMRGSAFGRIVLVVNTVFVFDPCESQIEFETKL